MKQVEKNWDTKKRKYTPEVGRILERMAEKWLDPETSKSQIFIPQDGITVRTVTLTDRLHGPKARVLIGYVDNRINPQASSLLELKYLHLQDFLSSCTKFNNKRGDYECLPNFTFDESNENELYTEKEFRQFTDQNSLLLEFDAFGRIKFEDVNYENERIIIYALIDGCIRCQGSPVEFDDHIDVPLWLPEEKK